MFSLILNFFHPLIEWVLLAVGIWALYLGIKVKKLRESSPEERKKLTKGKFSQRHHRWGSLFSGSMAVGSLLGIGVTYLNNGKLFLGPHLIVGLVMGVLVSIAAALVPFMQGNFIIRKFHVGLNFVVLALFLWQVITGIDIINRILQNR